MIKFYENLSANFIVQEDIKMSQQVKTIKVAISENLINGIDL